MLQGYAEGEFVYIASPLSGKLDVLDVQRGQQVSIGDRLFRLDSASEKIVLDQNQAALAYSQGEFERQERLSKTGGVNTKADLDRARSARDQDKQRVAKAEWDLSQKSQNAPKAGFIFDTLYREGEWVNAGAPIVSLLPPENIKVRAFIPENRIGSLQLGDPVEIQVDGIGERMNGKVSFISPQAEYTPPVIYSRESRQKLLFMIEIALAPESAVKLHPGQPVDVRLPK